MIHRVVCSTIYISGEVGNACLYRCDSLVICSARFELQNARGIYQDQFGVRRQIMPFWIAIIRNVIIHRGIYSII